MRRPSAGPIASAVRPSSALTGGCGVEGDSEPLGGRAEVLGIAGERADNRPTLDDELLERHRVGGHLGEQVGGLAERLGAVAEGLGQVGSAPAGGRVELREQRRHLLARLGVEGGDREVEVDRLVGAAGPERRSVVELRPIALREVDEAVDRADVRGQADVGEGALAQAEIGVDRHPHLGHAVDSVKLISSTLPTSSPPALTSPPSISPRTSSKTAVTS